MKFYAEKKLIEILDYSNIQEYKVDDEHCENLAFKAKEAGINTVVIGAASLPIVESIIGDTDIKIAVSVSYPSGAYILKSKVQEIEGLFEIGARFDEIYVVMGVGRYLSGYVEEARKELDAFVKAARGKTVKVVIEAGVMDKKQKKIVCDIAADTGVDYIVSSTDFKPYDVPFPTVQDIKDLKEAAAGRVKIIACGDINTKALVENMLDAGADRVCTTSAFEIVREK